MTTNETSPEGLRDLAAHLVREAGAVLESGAVSEPATTTISGGELVGVARASQQLISDGLAAQRPGDEVLAEGVSLRPGSSGVRWTVHPLDGRLNYSYRLPSYGVSLAVEVDGVVVAAAVYAAPLGTVYDAVLGGGARADGEFVSCTSARDLALSLVGTGFSDSVELRTVQAHVLGELLPEVGNLRRIGPASLDLCAVGAGHLDAFFELGLESWDCAPGLLIASEAGARTGKVSTPRGDLVVAAAADVYGPLAETLRRLYEKYRNAGRAGTADGSAAGS